MPKISGGLFGMSPESPSVIRYTRAPAISANCIPSCLGKLCWAKLSLMASVTDCCRSFELNAVTVAPLTDLTRCAVI